MTENKEEIFQKKEKLNVLNDSESLVKLKK